MQPRNHNVDRNASRQTSRDLGQSPQGPTDEALWPQQVREGRSPRPSNATNPLALGAVGGPTPQHHYPLPPPTNETESKRLAFQHGVFHSLFRRHALIPPFDDSRMAAKPQQRTWNASWPTPPAGGSMPSLSGFYPTLSGSYPSFSGSYPAYPSSPSLDDARLGYGGGSYGEGGFTSSDSWRPHHVLDVACGTGLWLRDLAAQTKTLFPDITPTLLGIDLAPPSEPSIQDTVSGVQYHKHDILTPLPFPARNAYEQFQYVHARCIGLGVPVEAWGPLLSELLRVTAPGGYLEIVDTGMPVVSDPTRAPSMVELIQLAQAVCDHHGVDLGHNALIPDLLGMEPAVAGSWTLLQKNAQPFCLLGTRPAPQVARAVKAWIRALAWRAIELGFVMADEVQRLLDAMERECMSADPVGYLPMFVSCAQRRNA